MAQWHPGDGCLERYFSQNTFISPVCHLHPTGHPWLISPFLPCTNKEGSRVSVWPGNIIFPITLLKAHNYPPPSSNSLSWQQLLLPLPLTALSQSPLPSLMLSLPLHLPLPVPTLKTSPSSLSLLSLPMCHVAVRLGTSARGGCSGGTTKRVAEGEREMTWDGGREGEVMYTRLSIHFHTLEKSLFP